MDMRIRAFAIIMHGVHLSYSPAIYSLCLCVVFYLLRDYIPSMQWCRSYGNRFDSLAAVDRFPVAVALSLFQFLPYTYNI